MSFPIVTARLRLRPLHRDDRDALAEVYLDPLVDRWIGPNTLQDIEVEIAQQIEHQSTFGWSFWAVEERASGRFVGDCGLQPLEHRGPEVELGYDLHPDFWGRGLASEAAAVVIRQAFGPLGLGRVIAVVKPDNVASQRVLENAGLEPTGMREAYGEPLLLYTAERRGPGERT